MKSVNKNLMNHIPLPEGLRQTITRSQVKGLSNSREDALRNIETYTRIRNYVQI